MSDKWTPEPWVLTREGDKFIISTDEWHELAFAWGGHRQGKHNANRIVQCVNAMANIENPSEFMKQIHYQLNQVLKEFSKYGTIGDYRAERVRQALSLFPKEAVIDKADIVEKEPEKYSHKCELCDLEYISKVKSPWKSLCEKCTIEFEEWRKKKRGQ